MSEEDQGAGMETQSTSLGDFGVTADEDEDEQESGWTPSVGDWCEDAEDDNPNTMLVLEVTDTPASEWVIQEMPPEDADLTVAYYNRNFDAYDDDDPVVAVVYWNTLLPDEEDEETSPPTPKEVIQRYEDDPESFKQHHFPHPRLNEGAAPDGV